jgi:hypothetical protein
MTPAERLPVEISLLKPPTFPIGLTRFGTARYAPKQYTQNEFPVENERDPDMDVDEELEIAARKEILGLHNLYENSGDYERVLENERQAITLQEIQQFAVPVQPRRYLPQNQQISPIAAPRVIAQPRKSPENVSKYHLRSQSANTANSSAHKPRGAFKYEGELSNNTVEGTEGIDNNFEAIIKYARQAETKNN